MVNQIAPQILLVFNDENQIGNIDELPDILCRKGHSYNIAVGREQALARIRSVDYRAVCISSSELDLGSIRMPPQKYLREAGYHPGDLGGYLTRNASALEVASAARKRNLGVVVIDEDDNPIVTSSFIDLGANPLSFWTFNAHDIYDELARFLG